MGSGIHDAIGALDADRARLGEQLAGLDGLASQLR